MNLRPSYDDDRSPLCAGGSQRRTSTNPGSRIGTLHWPLLAILVIAIVLRLWFIYISPIDPRFSNADDGDYYRRAMRLAASGQYIDDAWLIRPPLHVFFFAFWLWLAIELGRPQLGVLLIQLAQTALGTLTVVLGYGVARRLFAAERAGLLFALLLALWFPFVELPTVLYSELLYLFLFLLHVWLLLRFDAHGRWRDLARAGVALGAAALTRSPALYALAFVALWLLARWSTKHKEQTTTSKEQGTESAISLGSLFSVLCPLFLVAACCLAVVAPWTARNYLVYQRFIPVDTLGPINLWLDLDAPSRRSQHIDELRRIPQADRQAYALAQVRAILADDPLRPFRALWPTFRHIWKAQYVEDFFVKQSFFTRPLREAAPLGLLGDLLWFGYTLAGLIGLAAPVREGWHNRLFVLAWLGYSLLTVLIFHVEPRYLLPIWTLIGLYGAGALARAQRWMRAAGQEGAAAARLRAIIARRAAILPIGLGLVFIWLLFSYRDYPAIIAGGLARERALVAGERAYASGDYAAAERAFRAALAAQPNFVDAQVNLALALAAQGRSAEAAEVVRAGGSRRAELLAASLALRLGRDVETARATLARIEATAGEAIQHWARVWLRPPPATALILGDGQDLGYLEGFSSPEYSPNGSFRWLAATGRVVLPLPHALHPGATLVLRMAGGRPGATPLEVRVAGGPPQPVPVQGGQWRVYRLLLPATTVQQRQLAIELRAPPFVPARLDPSSNDLRIVSLMVSAIRAEELRV
jgi:4-amino-4-deoxy-L-arabinose transferase-like glycosyltransferase